MGTIVKLDSVQDYNELLGVETLHPLVSVVDFSELESVRHCLKNFGFYCIFLKHLDCGPLLYGRNRYDYREGTLVFIAPGQVFGIDDGKILYGYKGWCLMFHPDLLRGTSLARRMADYSFFSYSSNEALHMSEREQQIIINCFREIREELQHAIDKHSKQIIAANIEVLLNHCVRFYDRQFVGDFADRPAAFGQQLFGAVDGGQLNVLLCRFSGLLLDQIAEIVGRQVQPVGAPRHRRQTQRLRLVRREIVPQQLFETGQQVLIHVFARNELGFKYPHHLSRLFKKVVGYTPNEYKTLSA